MNKININKGRNLMKTMAAVVLVGMSTAGCVDMDLSPNGKPAEGNVWSTPTLAEQTIAGVYNQLYVDYSDVANGWFDIWSSTMDYGIGIAPTFLRQILRALLRGVLLPGKDSIRELSRQMM